MIKKTRRIKKVWKKNERIKKRRKKVKEITRFNKDMQSMTKFFDLKMRQEEEALDQIDLIENNQTVTK